MNEFHITNKGLFGRRIFVLFKKKSMKIIFKKLNVKEKVKLVFK